MVRPQRARRQTQRTQRIYESYEKDKIKKNKPREDDPRPQLALLLKRAAYIERSLILPYELLMKIFHHVVEISDNPLKDLWSISLVSETWRLMVIQEPSLWSRIDFRELPITDGNIRILKELVALTPTIIDHVQEISIKGEIRFKDPNSMAFLESLLTSPRLNKLSIDGIHTQNRGVGVVQLSRAITKCHKLKHLSIKNAKLLMTQQSWMRDYLMERGKFLEELHLTSSMLAVNNQLARACGSDYCPRLRVLDLSTCDHLNTHSFDVISLCQLMPDLVILRMANVSVRRIFAEPEQDTLTKLEELSMPIGIRDADRDDCLLAWLTYGTQRLTTLDIRGSGITAHALINIPSEQVRELHIDDICPLTRAQYWKFISRWQSSLEVLSLVKINCSETIRTCLYALTNVQKAKLKELDLESSDVSSEDLKKFLDRAPNIETVNLSSCRSLPRGFKGRYSKIESNGAQPLNYLLDKLQSLHPDSDSETEIDEEYQQISPKRKRIRTRRYDVDYALI